MALFLAAIVLAALAACDDSIEVSTLDGGSGANTEAGGSGESDCPQIPGCTFVNSGFGCNGGCIGSSSSSSGAGSSSGSSSPTDAAGVLEGGDADGNAADSNDDVSRVADSGEAGESEN